MRTFMRLGFALLAAWTMLAALSTHAGQSVPASTPAPAEPLVVVGRGYYTVDHVVFRDMKEVLGTINRQRPAAIRLRVCENAVPDEVERLLEALRSATEGRVWMERVKPKMLECTRPEVHSEPT